MGIAATYDERYYRSREATRDFAVEAELLYGLLRPGPDSRILEVGCGGGAFLAFLEGKGHRPTGVDVLEEALEAARRIAPRSEVLAADAASLPFADAAFDRLVTQHLVEHLDDFSSALAEWRRVLAPGGVMAICTPNRLYPCPSLFDDPGHVHVYGPEELRRAVEDAGFEVSDCLTVFPHLWKGKISVWIGVPLYRPFMRLPRFRERGRSLLLSAVRA